MAGLAWTGKQPFFVQLMLVTTVSRTHTPCITVHFNRCRNCRRFTHHICNCERRVTMHVVFFCRSIYLDPFYSFSAQSFMVLMLACATDIYAFGTYIIQVAIKFNPPITPIFSSHPIIYPLMSDPITFDSSHPILSSYSFLHLLRVQHKSLHLIRPFTHIKYPTQSSTSKTPI